MDLITAVQSKFDQLAPQLFEEGRAQATVAVHRTLEGLAFDYADSLGLAFGVHGRSHPASKNPESEKRILVFSSKSS